MYSVRLVCDKPQNAINSVIKRMNCRWERAVLQWT